MNKTSRHLLWAATVSLWPVAAFAAHPLVTEDTGTQGRGNWQLEVMAESGRDIAEDVKTKTLDTTAVLAYGFAETADVILSLPHHRVTTEEAGTTTKVSGTGDVGLDIKWRFYEKGPLSFALKPGITFSTGDDAKGLGAGKRGHSLFFVTSVAVEPWTFHLHAGYAHNENVHGERERLWHASYGGWYEFNDKLKLILDLGADTNADPAEKVKPAFLIAGLIYSVSKDLDLDIGYKQGLSGPETDHTVLAGMAVRF